MTIEEAVARTTAFLDKVNADNLMKAAQQLRDEAADRDFAEQVLTTMFASYLEHRQGMIDQARAEIEAFVRGDYDPTRH